MKEVLVIAMWEYKDKVVTRTIVVDSKSKEIKLNGKKPNRMIVPESCIDIKLLRKIKNMSAYNCKIVTAVGK